MSNEIVVRCWNCEKKFTISASGANPAMTIYRGSAPPAKPVESRGEKKRLLKTCPYCGAENEIKI